MEKYEKKKNLTQWIYDNFFDRYMETSGADELLTLYGWLFPKSVSSTRFC